MYTEGEQYDIYMIDRKSVEASQDVVVELRAIEEKMY